MEIYAPPFGEYTVDGLSPINRRGALLGRIPAAFFAIAVGLFALGSAWRAASSLWGMPSVVGEMLMATGGAVWLAVSALYISKWIWARSAARAEWVHPVQCCFIALAPVSTLLAALAVRPHLPRLAQALFWVGASGQAAFMVDRAGTLWAGGRNPLTTTPVLYLPTVAGSFVSAIVSSAFGYSTLANLSFGVGFFSWLALESVVLQRLLIDEPLEGRLLPTLGVQLAPPVVGCVAYLGLSASTVDRFALMLLGYGLLQALILIRLTPRFRTQPFATSYWAFALGVSGLALASIRVAARTADGDGRAGMTSLAMVLFVVANVVVGVIFLRTIGLAVRGRLLPPLPAGAPVPAATSK